MAPEHYPNQDGHGGYTTGYYVQQNEYGAQSTGQPQYGQGYQTAGGHDPVPGYGHPNGADVANPRTSMDNEPGSGWEASWTGNGEGSSNFHLPGVQTEPILGRYLEEDQRMRKFWTAEDDAQETGRANDRSSAQQVAKPVDKGKKGSSQRAGNNNKHGGQRKKKREQQQ